MTMTFFALRLSIMYSASCGPWTSSRETTRKKVGRLPSVSVVLVADPETNPRLARVKIGPTASTSWLPAGPTTTRIALLDSICCATVLAWAGSSCVSPSTMA